MVLLVLVLDLLALFQSLRFRQLLFYDYESAADFVHDRREVDREQRLLRIDDHVGARRRGRAREPHSFAQSALHPVTLHRAAEGAAYGESDAQSRCGRLRCEILRRGFRLRPRPIENRHGRGKMPPPQLVDALEVGVPQQPRVAGKGGVAGRPGFA